MEFVRVERVRVSWVKVITNPRCVATVIMTRLTLR